MMPPLVLTPQVFHKAGISLDDGVINLGNQQNIDQKKTSTPNIRQNAPGERRI